MGARAPLRRLAVAAAPAALLLALACGGPPPAARPVAVTASATLSREPASAEAPPPPAPTLVSEDLVVGTGEAAGRGDHVSMHYVGTLADGTVFDSSRKRNRPLELVLGRGQVIAGWEQGVPGMKVGGKRKLVIPPELAYGARGQPPVIPANATLSFEIELVAVEHAAAADEAHPRKITARHVLVQYMGAQTAGSSIVRTREQARTVAAEVLERAKAGDDFGRLAVEYSDEVGAGSRGGNIGSFERGKFVPEFDAAAFALRRGEISAVVETPLGFHIIQRLE